MISFAAALYFRHHQVASHALSGAILKTWLNTIIFDSSNGDAESKQHESATIEQGKDALWSPSRRKLSFSFVNCVSFQRLCLRAWMNSRLRRNLIRNRGSILPRGGWIHWWGSRAGTLPCNFLIFPSFRPQWFDFSVLIRNRGSILPRGGWMHWWGSRAGTLPCNFLIFPSFRPQDGSIFQFLLKIKWRRNAQEVAPRKGWFGATNTRAWSPGGARCIPFVSLLKSCNEKRDTFRCRLKGQKCGILHITRMSSGRSAQAYIGPFECMVMSPSNASFSHPALETSTSMREVGMGRDPQRNPSWSGIVSAWIFAFTAQACKISLYSFPVPLLLELHHWCRVSIRVEVAKFLGTIHIA